MLIDFKKLNQTVFESSSFVLILWNYNLKHLHIYHFSNLIKNFHILSENTKSFGHTAGSMTKKARLGVFLADVIDHKLHNIRNDEGLSKYLQVEFNTGLPTPHLSSSDSTRVKIQPTIKDP